MIFVECDGRKMVLREVVRKIEVGLHNTCSTLLDDPKVN